jgi:hypothetical protein
MIVVEAMAWDLLIPVDEKPHAPCPDLNRIGEAT